MITEILETERIKSKHGGITKRNDDIISLVQSVIENLPDDTQGIRIQLPTQPVILSIDGQRVQVAVKNVIQNALKYSHQSKRPVEISSGRTGKYFYLIVKDYGPGIPNEDIPFLTESFYRVDKSRSKETGGFGLGLSLVHTIMQAHDGSIDITSTVGKGTEVRLKFPL